MSCQALPITGFRPTTLQNQFMHAAVLYRNGNEAMLAEGGADALANAINPDNVWEDHNGISVAPRLLGATKGGVSSFVGSTYGPMEIDGVLTPVIGMNLLTGSQPRISTAGLTELGDYEIVQMLAGGADVTITNGMAKIQPRVNLCEEDYIGNIMAVGQLSRDNSYLVAVLRGAFVLETPEIASQNNQNNVAPITWVGHAPPNAINSIPIAYYVPVLGS